MKKYIRYIGVLIGGIILGWLFFGIGDKENNHNHDSLVYDVQVWTCSMHPQIKRDEPGNCPICGMDLIPLSNSNGANPMAIKLSPTAMQLANVQSAIVEYANPEKIIRLNGTVQADERFVSSQTTHIKGRVEQLLVNFTGEAVTKGQILAYVYSPELISAQKELLEAHKLIELQPQLFESAKMKLRNWKLTDETLDLIVSTDKIIENFPIRADRNGVIISKMVNLGDYLNQGSTIYEIADLSRLWVWFDVYERDLNWVKKGNKIKYSFNSYPGEVLQGIVQFVEPSINPQTRTARARIDVKNSNEKYKPEMFVIGKVKSRLPSRNKEISIPKTALMWTGERSIVYLVTSTENGTSYILKEVTLGESLGDRFIVKEGLNIGDEIVVNGTFSVDAAAQLAGKPSMMNLDGGMIAIGHDHSGGGNEIEKKTTSTLNTEANRNLGKIFNAYQKLKDNLVSDDFEESQKSSLEFKKELNQTSMNLFNGENHEIWMRHSTALKKLNSAFSKSNNIQEARDHFIQISEQMILITKSLRPKIDKLYIQYCPMADGNKGAKWLSKSKIVKNPYFGASMLKCGEVLESIN